MGIPVEDEKPIVDEKSTIVEDKPTEKKTKTQFRTVQLGIWEIVFPVSAGRSLILPSVTDLKVYLSTFGLIFRLFKDIYALAPRKFFAFILAEFAESCESGINLYLDSQIWDSVCAGGFQFCSNLTSRKDIRSNWRHTDEQIATGALPGITYSNLVLCKVDSETLVSFCIISRESSNF